MKMNEVSDCVGETPSNRALIKDFANSLIEIVHFLIPFEPVNDIFDLKVGTVICGPKLYPRYTIVIIVAWQWLPFALLILLTAMQSLDEDQVEAARMDGAGPVAIFFFITLPHLKRAISVVIMIEMIFLLTIFAEIFVTTSGGPGLATTNLAYLIYIRALLDFDVGVASAGGVIAIILANIVAIFLVRMVAKNLED